jgi:hypothetical protein
MPSPRDPGRRQNSRLDIFLSRPALFGRRAQGMRFSGAVRRVSRSAADVGAIGADAPAIAVEQAGGEAAAVARNESFLRRIFPNVAQIRRPPLIDL